MSNKVIHFRSHVELERNVMLTKIQAKENVNVLGNADTSQILGERYPCIIIKGETFAVKTTLMTAKIR